MNYSDERRVFFGLYDVARRTRDTPVPLHIAFERARYRLEPETFKDHLEERVWHIAEDQVCLLCFVCVCVCVCVCVYVRVCVPFVIWGFLHHL